MKARIDDRGSRALRVLGFGIVAVGLLACGGSSGTSDDTGSGGMEVPAPDEGAWAEGPDDPGGAMDRGAADDRQEPDDVPGLPDSGPNEVPPEGEDAPIADPVGDGTSFEDDREATDPGSSEVPDPGPDPSPGEIGPEVSPPGDLEPWTQCREDRECRAVLGPAAWCNRDFPGGQCAGCDPWDLGHERCTMLGRAGTTLSCKETVPNVCLFDCPCPPWLRCADLGDLRVCVLRTCRTDSECAPLVCRPLSEGGTSYCLEAR